MGKYGKKWVRYEKVWEMMGNYGNVCDSMEKNWRYGIVWEVMGRYGNI